MKDCDTTLLMRHLMGMSASPATCASTNASHDASRRTIRSLDGPDPLTPASRNERPGLHRHPATELLPAMRSLTCASVRNSGVPVKGTQMHAAIAIKWADALESDRFKRGARRLKDAAGRHSALGVLCELHREACPGMPEMAAHGASYLGESMLLPRIVLEWAGMSHGDGQGPCVAIKSRLTRQWRAYAVNVHELVGASWQDLARAMREQI